MIYLQSLMPSRVGLAAALFSNAVSVGAIFSGALTGPWASAFGYASVFGFCVALTIAGSDSDPDAEQSRPSDPWNSGGAVRCHPVRRERSRVSFAHH